jgi:hypothetical protein
MVRSGVPPAQEGMQLSQAVSLSSEQRNQIRTSIRSFGSEQLFMLILSLSFSPKFTLLCFWPVYMVVPFDSFACCFKKSNKNYT